MCNTFGKRHAHYQFGVPLEKYPQPDFTVDDEFELTDHIRLCHCLEGNYDQSDRARAEYEFLCSWYDAGHRNDIVSASNKKSSNYYQSFKRCSKATANLASSSSSSDILGLMHERTGHLNKRALIECVKSKLVEGLQIDDSHIRRYRKSDKDVCDVCARAKLTRKAFHKIHAIRGKELGDYISVDIAVFVNCPSREGFKYVACFVDHATKFSWVYSMKTRDEFLEKLRNFIDVELVRLNSKIKHYHGDGGAELISKQVLSLLRREGSNFTWNPADTPELNATSERKFRTLGERCLSMLLRSGLPVDFWWDAYEASNYITNRLPTKTSRGYRTPFEGVFASVPNLSNLRVWVCKTILNCRKHI